MQRRQSRVKSRRGKIDLASGSFASYDHGKGPNLTKERAFADVYNHLPGFLVDSATNAPVDGEIKLLSSEDLSSLVFLEFA
jgi:hypothetical protein